MFVQGGPGEGLLDLSKSEGYISQLFLAGIGDLTLTLQFEILKKKSNKMTT